MVAFVQEAIERHLPRGRRREGACRPEEKVHPDGKVAGREECTRSSRPGRLDRRTLFVPSGGAADHGHPERLQRAEVGHHGVGCRELERHVDAGQSVDGDRGGAGVLRTGNGGDHLIARGRRFPPNRFGHSTCADQGNPHVGPPKKVA